MLHGLWGAGARSVSGIGGDTGPVLVIDAGHGGEDGGAVSADGLLESEVNLDIALRVRDLARFLGIPAVLTRDSQELDYPPDAKTTAARKKWDTRRRVEQVNAIPNAVLVSIHQNCYPASGPWGSQVLYGDSEDSRILGERLHEALVAQLAPENRRVAAPADKDIYLMSHVDCTAVLVECGFLSNPRESGLLATDSYRLKLAAVIAGAFYAYAEDRYEAEDYVLLHTVRQ